MGIVKKVKGQMNTKCAYQMIKDKLGEDYRGSCGLLDSVGPDSGGEILDSPLLKLDMDYTLLYVFEPRSEVTDPRVKEIALKLSEKFRDEVLEPTARLVADFVIKYKGVSMISERQNAGCMPYGIYLAKDAAKELLASLD